MSSDQRKGTYKRFSSDEELPSDRESEKKTDRKKSDDSARVKDDNEGSPKFRRREKVEKDGGRRGDRKHDGGGQSRNDDNGGEGGRERKRSWEASRGEEGSTRRPDRVRDREERRDTRDDSRPQRERSPHSSGSNDFRRQNFFKRDNNDWRPRRDQQMRGGGSYRGKQRDFRNFRQQRQEEGDREGEATGDRPVWATKNVIRNAEEIQQRKLIWAKKEEKKDDGGGPSPSASGAVGESARRSTESAWNSILAASSSDSKQIDKFKRLMGMKKGSAENEDGKTGEGGAGSTVPVDTKQVEAERERQNKMYAELDEQYAVARAITHLGRGHGLGFHS